MLGGQIIISDSSGKLFIRDLKYSENLVKVRIITKIEITVTKITMKFIYFFKKVTVLFKIFTDLK